MTHTLVVLRHAESLWNAENRFTGWVDIDLSPKGEQEAENAGDLLAREGLSFDICHTSLLTRAVRTANIALDRAHQCWLPIHRNWRLNERHYGDLQGKDKAQTVATFGSEQVQLWRRSYDVPPPPLAPTNASHPAQDRRYRYVAPEALPASECLKDVLVRVLPWWQDVAVPQLRSGQTMLVVAHGNSLRALMKHLERIGDQEIVDLNVATAMPRIYRFHDDMTFAEPPRYLDAAAARSGAEAVKKQTG